MKLDAWLFRVGEVLALVAIYAAAGGPKIGDGGATMAVAAVLMVVPLFYHGAILIRRYLATGEEVPA